MRLQAPTQRTPLTRLVDAARPDPWARSQMNRLAAQVARDPKGAIEARGELRRMLTSWRPLATQLTALGDTLPLARDGIPAALALGRLADIGLGALDRLATGGASVGWRDSSRVALDSLARPQGLLRLAGVEAVGTLVEAVP